MRILAALEREGVHYVLVGSMGMAIHGIVRLQDKADAAELERRFALPEDEG